MTDRRRSRSRAAGPGATWGLAAAVLCALAGVVLLDVNNEYLHRNLRAAVLSIDPAAGMPGPSAPAPAAPPAEARLLVGSLPEGATLLVDGRLARPTESGVVDVSAGSHRVEVRTRDGGEWVSRVSAAPDGETPVRPDLTGEAIIEAAPGVSGAIYLDGSAAGPPPLVVDSLAAGTHRAALMRGGRVAWEEEFLVPAGGVAHVTATAGDPDDPGRLNVTARLLSDNGFIDRTGARMWVETVAPVP